MEPREIAGHPDIRVIGLSARFIHTFSADCNRPEVIPALWDRWGSREQELDGRVGGKRFGVVYSEPGPAQHHADEMVYLAGCWVTPQAVLPQGMLDIEVPTQIWARFEHQGPIAALHDTLEGIYLEWLPNSDWLHSGLDLEIYPDGYEPDSETARMEYWIAVEPKPAEEEES